MSVEFWESVSAEVFVDKSLNHIIINKEKKTDVNKSFVLISEKCLIN